MKKSSIFPNDDTEPAKAITRAKIASAPRPIVRGLRGDARGPLPSSAVGRPGVEARLGRERVELGRSD